MDKIKPTEIRIPIKGNYQFRHTCWDDYGEIGPNAIFKLESISIEAPRQVYSSTKFYFNLVGGLLPSHDINTEHEKRVLMYLYPLGNFEFDVPIFKHLEVVDDNDKVILEPYTKEEEQEDHSRAIDDVINDYLDKGKIEISHLDDKGRIVYKSKIDKKI